MGFLSIAINIRLWGEISFLLTKLLHQKTRLVSVIQKLMLELFFERGYSIALNSVDQLWLYINCKDENAEY